MGLRRKKNMWPFWHLMLLWSSPSAFPPQVRDRFEVIKTGKDKSSVYNNLRNATWEWKRACDSGRLVGWLLRNRFQRQKKNSLKQSQLLAEWVIFRRLIRSGETKFELFVLPQDISGRHSASCQWIPLKYSSSYMLDGWKQKWNNIFTYV